MKTAEMQILIIVNLVFCSFSFVQSISFSEIKDLFGEKYCISGSLPLLKHGYYDAKEVLSEKEISPQIENIMISSSNEEKSAMSSINELAQYNEISYSYELINEEGPAHSKTFTIKLFLGDEQYTSEGKSLKMAQQGAASEALKNTHYEHPPVKIKENAQALTPTVLLNNLAAKLGLSVTYTLTDDILEELENSNQEIDVRSRKSYLQKLNDTVHSNSTIHIRKDGSDLKGPFKIKVNVNDMKFIGEAHTIKGAKHEAAAKALNALKSRQDDFYCSKGGNSDECKLAKQNTKSPISLVYEGAQKRNLAVAFEIINEEGPAHKKIFTTKCVIGELEATGQGKSKKASKKSAAENILPKLLEIPEVEGAHPNLNVKSKSSKRKNKKNKVIKTTFDKIDRMFDNVVDYGKNLINKISGNEENTDKDVKSSNNRKDKKNVRSPSVEIIELGNILNLEIQFSDFVENGKTYSVLDLGTKPSFICLGEGINEKNSRDLAAKHGINTLHKLGLLDNLLDSSMKISNILDKEKAYQNIWLEVVDNNKNKESDNI